MTEAAYFNVHGQPLALSARDAVLAREPLAYAENRNSMLERSKLWVVLRRRVDGKPNPHGAILGTGASEEAAWLNTLSRMRIADN